MCLCNQFTRDDGYGLTDWGREREREYSMCKISSTMSLMDDLELIRVDLKFPIIKFNFKRIPLIKCVSVHNFL